MCIRDSFQIETEALWLLKRFAWPGNVRQLRNVLECLIIRSTGEKITAAEVQQVLREQNRQHSDDSADPVQKADNLSGDHLSSPVDTINDYRAFFVSNGKLMIAEHLKSVEREVVTAALVAAENDIDIAAKMLHLSVAELVEKKLDLGIKAKPF